MRPEARTPLLTPGDQREDHAEAVAAILAAIFTRLEMALIGTVASLAQRVAGGALLPNLARRQLGQAVHVTYAVVQPRVQAVIEQAVRETAVSARQALPAALSAPRPPVPAPGAPAPARPVPRLVPQLPSATAPPAPPAPAPEPPPAVPAPAPGPLADVAASIERASQAAAASLGDTLDAAIEAAQDVAKAAQEAAPAAGTGTGGAVPPKLPANIPGPFRGEDDIYRRAVQRAVQPEGRAFVTQPLSLGRIQAAQQALDDLAGHGITGFTDAAGRNWDLVSYVEMATRTAVSNLWDDLQHGAMIRAGHDLAVIGTHSTEGSCPMCVPWLGKTISLTGATEGYPTLAEAKAAGWRHPSCRCFDAPVDAGIAEDVTNPVPLSEAAAVYRASQRQRALERRVRAAGRRYQAAITTSARRDARRDLLLARDASAAHRKAHGLVMTKVGVKRREHPVYAR